MLPLLQEGVQPRGLPDHRMVLCCKLVAWSCSDRLHAKRAGRALHPCRPCSGCMLATHAGRVLQPRMPCSGGLIVMCALLQDFKAPTPHDLLRWCACDRCAPATLQGPRALLRWCACDVLAFAGLQDPRAVPRAGRGCRGREQQQQLPGVVYQGRVRLEVVLTNDGESVTNDGESVTNDGESVTNDWKLVSHN